MKIALMILTAVIVLCALPGLSECVVICFKVLRGGGSVIEDEMRFKGRRGP